MRVPGKWLSAQDACRALRAAGSTVAVTCYRVLAAAGIASTAVLSTGCYTYAPRTTSDIAARSVIAADISDIGRIALTQQVGPEVARIEGEVVQRSDTSVRLMVSQVSYLGGLLNKWQGQEVALRTQDMKFVFERKLSRSRTALAAAMAGGLVVFALSSKTFRGIFTGGTGPDKPGGEPPDT